MRGAKPLCRSLLLLGVVAFCGPASADFPGDLEGELRSLGSAAEGPLVTIGEDSLGSFRVDGIGGTDIRLSPRQVRLVVADGSVLALGIPTALPAYPDLPLGELLGGFDWEANHIATVPGPRGYALPLVQFTETANDSAADLFAWNTHLQILRIVGIPYPFELFRLTVPEVLAAYSGGGSGPIRGTTLGHVLYFADRLPSQDCTGEDPGCAMRDLILSLTSEPLAGDPFSDGSDRWIWEAGRQLTVVYALGSLAPYRGWSLWMLGPERDRTGAWKRGAAFILVPSDGASLPPEGTPFFQDGLAGAYGVDTRAPRCEGADDDGDGVLDECDNCITAANESQTDTDGDDVGNACDCDFDQNGFCNIDDFLVFLADFSEGRDAGTGTDMNADGFVNVDDVPPFLSGFIEGRPGPPAP